MDRTLNPIKDRVGSRHPNRGVLTLKYRRTSKISYSNIDIGYV